MSIEIGGRYRVNFDPEDLAAMNPKERPEAEAHQGQYVTVTDVAGTFPPPLGTAYWVRADDGWEESLYADELLPPPGPLSQVSAT